MSSKEKVRNELATLLKDVDALYKLCKDTKDTLEFGTQYQQWYTRALKIVEALAPDRLDEFISYYQIDPKRKLTNVDNYVIQDYIKGIGARTNSYDKPLWDVNNLIAIRVYNQEQILSALSSRVDGVLADVVGTLFAELQDAELKAAAQLSKINARAAGSLAGVVLERHIQRVATNHAITIQKKHPTISDLNDPLKNAGVYDTPTWRKIQYLGDIRNLCSHNKSKEPSDEDVEELLSGVDKIIKTIF